MNPIRPTPADVSVKNGGPGCYSWYQGHTADQCESDAMELARIGLWWPQAVLAGRAIGINVSQSIAGMARTFYTFLPVYVSRTIIPSGKWIIGNQLSQYGHFYNDEELALNQLRSLMLGHLVIPALTSDLMVLLDISVSSGKIIAGNPAKRAAPIEVWNSVKASDDPINTTKKPPALSSTQLSLLQAAEDAHSAGTNVLQTQFDFEASALDGQEHFFLLPPFVTAIDPIWNSSEVSKLTALTDVFHKAWAQGIRTLDAGMAYTNGLFHMIAHVMRAIGSDDNLKVRLPAPGVKIENRPIQTTRQVLATL